jgi:hypothetical protein
MDAFEDRLSAWLDGELPTEEAAEVEAHVGSCETCRTAVRELKAVRGMLSQLPRDKAPLALLDGVMERLEARSRGNLYLFHRWVIGVASAAAAIVIIVFASSQFQPEFYHNASNQTANAPAEMSGKEAENSAFDRMDEIGSDDKPSGSDSESDGSLEEFEEMEPELQKTKKAYSDDEGELGEKSRGARSESKSDFMHEGSNMPAAGGSAPQPKQPDSEFEKQAEAMKKEANEELKDLAGPDRGVDGDGAMAQNAPLQKLDDSDAPAEDAEEWGGGAGSAPGAAGSESTPRIMTVRSDNPEETEQVLRALLAEQGLKLARVEDDGKRLEQRDADPSSALQDPDQATSRTRRLKSAVCPDNVSCSPN